MEYAVNVPKIQQSALCGKELTIMAKCVYLVRDEGERIKEILAQKGYEIIVGNGKLDDSALARCDAIVPGKAYITAEVLDKAPNARIVSKFGVGMDRTDIDACTARGIYAANTPTANFVSVAEHTVALMLAAAKKVAQISRCMHHDSPDWDGARLFQGIELSGKTLTLIGFGNIGGRVAKLLSGFEMRILAYDPYTPEDRVPEYVELTRDLDYALSQGDFVSIHVAGTASTKGLIGEHELAQMKKSAIIVNTTRGFVIDEPALIVALQNGVIAGAALDVFTQEPLGPGNPLMTMENVVATPHNAANTPEARLRAQIDCAENIIQCFEEGRPRRALNNPADPRK